jgi:hypothetical protein
VSRDPCKPTPAQEIDLEREANRGLPCTSGKQKKITKARARAQAQSLRKNRRDKTRTTAYWCGFCGYWHIGRR